MSSQRASADWRRPSRVGPAVTLVFTMLCLVARSSGYLEGAELQVYDLFRRVQASAGLPEPRIAVVGITDADMDRFGYPIPDDVLADLLERLLAAGPRAVGVDLYRTIPVPPGQERLRHVVTENIDRIVLARFGVAEEGRVQLLDWLEREAALAFVDQRADPGGVVRRAILYMWEDGRPGGSLSLELALRWLHADGITQGRHPDSPGGLALGHALLEPLPSDAGGYLDADTGGFQQLMDYRNAASPFERATLGSVLDGTTRADFGREQIVLIGTTAETIKDHFYTPLSRGIARTSQTVFGVELHAHQASQLLRMAVDGERPTRPIPEALEIAGVFAACLLGGALGLWRGSALLSGLFAVGGLCGISALGFQALALGRWVPIVPVEIGFAASIAAVWLYCSYYDRSERELVMQLFGKFTGSAIAASLWERRDEFMDGGRVTAQSLPLTVLMTDLQGFTSASERMPPPELMDWINEYMDRMTGLIEAHGGFVDDFAGDGIKANFGVPLPRETEDAIARDAENAIDCALEMGRAIEQLNESWHETGRPQGRVRIGIQTGSAVVGAIGGTTSMRYTTMGDVVNTAARLETHDKEGFMAEPEVLFRIHVGADTMKRVGDRFVAESIGHHALRGRQQEIEIFRVRARRTPREESA